MEEMQVKIEGSLYKYVYRWYDGMLYFACRCYPDMSYFGGGGVVTYSIVCKMLNMRFAGPMKTGIKWILSLKLCCSKKKV